VPKKSEQSFESKLQMIVVWYKRFEHDFLATLLGFERFRLKFLVDVVQSFAVEFDEIIFG
jgi:hypothetical protein